MIMQDRFRSRIWDHEAEEMIDNVFGYVIDPERGKIRYYRTDETQPGGMGTKVVLLEAVTLEQCTGIMDRTDKPLVEGDVCEMVIIGTREQLIEVNGSMKGCLYRVELQFGCWGISPIFPELQHEDDQEWKPMYCEEDGEMVWPQFRRRL